ncbi:mechanosensitive ion channel [Pseudolysinimonas kribbensis]|uniref:Mechanosensitive ion channel protein MscS n=1 Tax=Pseudolysinimonas kribbensis TaxID=433641 RepID=A0ABQ6K4C4_9MICO|nr:mechanosensitive ion channel family protein [Pseudolysinimonas kribbensis]GMA95288.1 mechanosensitive ion channel protein MscS [Pseudolysinimonas kribbensis]
MGFTQHSWPTLAVAVAAAIVLALLVAGIVSVIVGAVARRRQWQGDPMRHLRLPFRAALVVALVSPAIVATWPAGVHHAGSRDHVILIVAIVVGAWFIGAVLGFVIGVAMGRYRVDVPDNRVARRVRTQLAVIRRLIYVILFVLAIGAVLLTFPGVQAVGTSVLASAGVISVVAGLAAQSTLSNLFAGIQLAFSGAIRVDDVVVVEQEWGRIEEITLSYVVVHVWDDRRLVLPCTWFTQNPFENWTRTSSQLLGAVEFDLDWRVSPGRMRAELDRILDDASLWDHRAKVLQVTDAVGGYVHVRVLVTARDAAALFDLRCLVRERLVDWLQRETPEALPTQRVEVEREHATSARRRSGKEAEPEGVFSGSDEAERRAHNFTGTNPVVRSDADEPDAGQ